MKAVSRNRHNQSTSTIKGTALILLLYELLNIISERTIF